MLRSARVALALGVVAFGLAAPALPGLAATCASASVTGSAQPTIRVAVVVDDGTSSPRVDCIVVAARSVNGELRATGAAVLAARAAQLSLPAPRWGASGLLCGIDGAPATGCAAPGSAGYVYWSYWQGETGQWVYSSTGPAYRHLKDGAVDGWRFGNGGGTGDDRAPRTSASSARCPSAPDPGPPATTPPAPPTNPVGGGGAAPATPTTRAGSTPGAGPGTKAGAGPGPAPSTTIVAPGGPAAGEPTTTIALSGDPATTVPNEPTTTTIETEVEAASQERADGAVEIPSSSDGGGGWTGTAVGVGALGAAAVGLTVLGRRRRAAP